MKRHGVFLRFSIVAVVGMLVLSACSGSGAPVDTGANEQSGETTGTGSTAETTANVDSIDVGVITSLSGAIGDQGTDYANGIRLAVDEINANGGVQSMGGAEIRIHVEDDNSVPDTARNAATKLINTDRVSVIIGPYGSGTCLAAGPQIEQLQIPTICSATADPVTEQGYEYLFNRGTLASTYSQTLFAMLNEIGEATGEDLGQVAVLHEDGPFGSNGAEQASAVAGDYGAEVVFTGAFETGAPDLSSLVNSAIGADADAIFSPSFTADMINLLRAVAIQGSDVLVVGTATNVQVEAVTDLGDTSHGALATADWNPDLPNKPKLEEFLADFETEFGAAPGPAGAYGYSDAWGLHAALEAAGSTDSIDIRNAIDEIELTGDAPALTVVPYAAWGFDDDGLALEQENRVIGIQVQNGDLVTIWPERLASQEFVSPTG